MDEQNLPTKQPVHFPQIRDAFLLELVRHFPQTHSPRTEKLPKFNQTPLDLSSPVLILDEYIGNQQQTNKISLCALQIPKESPDPSKNSFPLENYQEFPRMPVELQLPSTVNVETPSFH